MKKTTSKIVLLTLALLPTIVFGQGAVGIRFEEELNWAQVLAKAKTEHKGIFVDCFTTWCGPCKDMDATVYPDEKVGKYFNANFICVRLQMDRTPKDDARVRAWYQFADEIRATYSIKGYPTFLFFSPEASSLAPLGILIGRGLGYQNPEALIALGQTAMKEVTVAVEREVSAQAYGRLKANYERGEKDYTAMKFIVKFAYAHHDVDFANAVSTDYINNYLLKLPEATLYTKENIGFIAAHVTSSGDRSFALFYPESKKINALFDQANPGVWSNPSSLGGFAGGVVNQIVSAEIITPVLQRAENSSEEVDWGQIGATITAKYDAQVAARTIAAAKPPWYAHKNRWPQAVDAFADLVRKYGTEALGFAPANEITRYLVIHCDDKNVLGEAIQWEKRVLDKDDKWWHGDDANYGALLYKVGRTQEAIQYVEQRIKGRELLWTTKGNSTLEQVRTSEDARKSNLALDLMKQGKPIDETTPADWFY